MIRYVFYSADLIKACNTIETEVVGYLGMLSMANVHVRLVGIKGKGWLSTSIHIL